jgi:hypothetical protein
MSGCRGRFSNRVGPETAGSAGRVSRGARAGCYTRHASAGT